MLLPLALASAAVVLPAAMPAAAAPAPTSKTAATRDISKIVSAELGAHARRGLKPLAKTGGNAISANLSANSVAPAGSFLQDTYPVGMTMGFTVDRARGVAARYPDEASSVRNLPITIWYPASSGATSSSDIFWANARSGHFPLVVFAPGYNSNPETYQPFLHAIAAQGYIVAAPTFPIEASIPGAAPAGRSNTEILNDMYDMSATITQMITYAHTPGNFLSWAMDPNQVGVIGHSDGAMTVAGMTMSTSYNDPRIKVAAVMAGAGPMGLTWNHRRVVPTMIEQATGDPYNAPSNSKWLFYNVTGPHNYLTVNGPYHIWPLIGNDQTSDDVRRAVIAQLDGTLKNGGLGAFWRLAAAGNVPGVTSLRFGS